MSKAKREILEAIFDGLDYMERRKALQKLFKENKDYRELVLKRRAKRKAERIGLSYWPALVYHQGIDSMAYKITEDVCHEVYKMEIGKDIPRYGDIDIEGHFCHGIWDSEGYYGVSPDTVKKLWYKFGAKDCSKFRIAISGFYKIVILEGFRSAWEAIVMDLPRLSAWELTCYFKGLRWLLRNEKPIYCFSVKAIVALGRLSFISRWAALDGVNPDEDDNKKIVRIRDLNWALVKKVKGRISLLDKYSEIPNGLWWSTFFDEISHHEEVREINFSLIRPAALRKVLDEFGVNRETDSATVLSAIKLSRLFGKDIQTIKKVVKEAGSLHDAGMFQLPYSNFNTEWGKWIISHSSAWKWTFMLDEIEKILGGRLPKNIREFNEALASALENDPEGWLRNQGVSDTEKYLRLYKKPHKSYEAVPQVHVEKDGYVLKKLDADDKRQPLAGLYTDCCQHLENAAASCAKASWLRGDCGIWALFDKKGNIVAQSFVWRSKNTLVLDSVEAKKDFRKKWVAEMFKEAAQQALGRLSIRKVYVGYTSYGLTEKVIKLCPSTKKKSAPMPLEGKIGYTDAHEVVVLCKL